MKIDMTNGQPTIDAHDLGKLFEIPPDQVHALMRAGEITSRFETGADKDAGKVRLTFFYQGRRVRVTCSATGTVLKTSRVAVE